MTPLCCVMCPSLPSNNAEFQKKLERKRLFQVFKVVNKTEIHKVSIFFEIGTKVKLETIESPLYVSDFFTYKMWCLGPYLLLCFRHVKETGKTICERPWATAKQRYTDIMLFVIIIMLLFSFAEWLHLTHQLNIPAVKTNVFPWKCILCVFREGNIAYWITFSEGAISRDSHVF